MMEFPFGRILVLLVYICVVSGTLFDLVDSDPDALLPELGEQSSLVGCTRRLYNSRVQRQDASGRRCVGTLTLAACSGSCVSQEIPEWKFPWKRSRHPVCSFSGRTVSTVVLEDCDEGASPEARIVQLVRPAACGCRPCRAATALCGWLPDSFAVVEPDGLLLQQ